MMKSIKSLQVGLLHFLVLLICGFTTFFLIKHVPFMIDIKTHNFILSDYLALGYFPIPPGYYLLIYLLDFVFHYQHPFVVSSFLVLSAMLWWKYMLVYQWLNSELPFRPIVIFSLAFSFLFLSPIFIPAIDGPYWYLGKFTQTIWHNSTLIASFPFCFLLFRKTFDWFESNKSADYYAMIALCFAILLIKPSFLFCYVPALPIYSFWREREFSALVRNSIFLSLGVFVLILIEKFLIFSWDPMIKEYYTAEEISQVVINPFFVWLTLSDQPLFDFVSSVPLVLMYLILWRKKAFDSPYFTFSFLLFFFALVIYAVFAESGFRQLHANFYWQIPVALFLTHLSILIAVAKAFLERYGKVSVQIKLMIMIYLLQFGFGLAYWFRLFTELTLS